MTERRLAGIPVSAGIAVGPVFGVHEAQAPVARRTVAPEAAEAELLRLDAAVAQSRRQLVKLRARLDSLPEASRTEMAPLLDAYLQMLGSSRLLRHARRRIAEDGLAAEAAILDETEATAVAMLAARPDSPDTMRQAEEVREIARRLLRNLTDTPYRGFGDLPAGAILAVAALRPSDVVLLDPARLAGVAAEQGGADGHAAVMLRALGLPAVLGVPGLMGLARAGETAVIDGGTGEVVLDPAAPALETAHRRRDAQDDERRCLAALRPLPAETQDGAMVELQANMELPAELPAIVEAGAAGIGLLRTEFLFMRDDLLPDEATQAAQYRAIVEAMAGRPATLRVLDWGGEKEGGALPGMPPAPCGMPNPALGLRGIRLLLRRPELLETQMAAMLRASLAGPCRIMLPMITDVTELRAARAILDRAVQRLRGQGVALPDMPPPLGVMVETPGAALGADTLALEADFLSIGTNDLTMYTLAIDRADTELAGLYDPLHPAVLRLVQFTIEASLRRRKPVSVCGEIASDPALTPLLLGLGLRSFSMRASALPRVKRAVRAARLEDCERLARRVMEETDPARVRAMLAGK